MDADTLAALRQSIEKWESVAAEKGEDKAGLNCALCQKFFGFPNFCEGCPVKTRTGQKGCAGSPYEDWACHHERVHFYEGDDRPLAVECGECRRLAEAQLSFLRGLLPRKSSTSSDHFRWWLKKGSGVILDLLHGVDTAFGRSAEEDAHAGIPYDPSPWRTLRRSLRLASLRPEKFTFVDIGCGKGRMLLSAVALPFVQVIGIELSPVLSKIAEQNVASARLIARRCSSVHVISADATQFAIPGGPNILFFYNPFSPEIMEIVLGNIVRSYLDNPRPVFLMFLGCSSTMPRIDEFLLTKTNGRARRPLSTNIGFRSFNLFELPHIEH